MRGEDFGLNIMKALALAMVAILIVTFIDKRLGSG